VVFYKIHGHGNDFIIIDNRVLKLDKLQQSRFAISLCHRIFGIGADGIIFIENSEKFSYRWSYFNKDGSHAEMCGNGARCVAYIANMLDITSEKHTCEIDGQIIEANINKNFVSISLKNPTDIKLNLDLADLDIHCHFTKVGVPHCVVFVDDLNNIDINNMGHKIRNHKLFQPEGVNVNFVNIINNESLNIRTYERGVEAETYSCGTGAVASAYVSFKLGLISNKVYVKTFLNQDPLVIDIRDDLVELGGIVNFVFEGKINF
jgi:diaminopimelate epimerase